MFSDRLHRAKCQKCYLEGCIICIEEYFNTSLSIERNEQQKNIDTLSLDEKNNRIEQEKIVIKERYNDIVIKFEKHIGKKKLGEIPEELMNEENNNVIIHPIKTCNKLGEIKAPQIECTIRIKEFLIKKTCTIRYRLYSCNYRQKNNIEKIYNLSRKTYDSTTSRRKS